MRTNLKLLVLAACCALLMQSCGDSNKPKVQSDNFLKGTAKIAVDESFSPIIDEEAYIFKAANPEANPVFQYRPETGVLDMLLNDSVRVAIMARELDTTETGIFKRRTLPPVITKFAIDAVAVIVNQQSVDTLLTLKDLKGMLNGTVKTTKSLVFDNPNSSLVRYLKQIAGVKNLPKQNIYALKSNKEVIKYVSTHQDAIGLTGFAWLNDPDDDYAAAVDKVKIVGVKNEDNKKAPNEYFKPSQSTLVQDLYPLSRSLYVIDCSGKRGLGAGFAWFLASERGQRIILKSGLLPDSLPQRQINITH